MDIKDNENPEMKDKVCFGEYAAFGAGSVGIIMLNSVLVSYLMIYMTNVAFLYVAVISVIIAVSKLLDGKEYFGLREIDGDLYLDTNDLVDVNEDGSLSFAGRTSRFFVNQEGRRFEAGLVETAVSGQPDIESCGIAPIHDKTVHDTVPALYVQLAGNVSRAEKVLRQALCNVYIDEGRIKETDLPVWCVITDRIPYNESGKVDVHKILTNEIDGKNYITEAVYTEGRLTDIKLVETDYPPGQMRPMKKKDRNTCFAVCRQ